MKRIGFVISTTKPGGVEIALLRTLRALDRKRFDPVVCVTHEHGSLRGEYEGLAAVVSEPIKVDVLNIYNNLLWAAAFWERLTEDVHPEVIQHVYMHAATLFWDYVKNEAYYQLLRNFFRHRYVVCDSPATADAIKQDVVLLLNMHPENYVGARRQRDTRGTQCVKVIRHPREPAGRSGVELSGRCLWIGAVTWVKGFDRLAQLIARHPKARFAVVVKTPPDENTSSELVTAYAAIEKQSHVDIHIALPSEQLAVLRADCDIYLSTSRREGQSLAWDEAKDAGLLCLDAGGAFSVPASMDVRDVADLWEGLL